MSFSVGIRTLAIAIVLATTLPGAAKKSPSLFSPPKDLMEDVPADFPRFVFPGHESDAQWLSRYLWYHFRNRSGHMKVLFNQEYVTTSDMWMAGGLHPGWDKPIQKYHRENLLASPIDEEGYVWTNQHFSHAHDHGWPFPLWYQLPTGPEGYTAGWHFQDSGPGWAWDYLKAHPDSPFGREKATEGWELENVRSLGIASAKWQLEASGPSPSIATPPTVSIDAFNAPFLQLRWNRTPKPPAGVLPYVEWMREGDTEFSPDRRVQFGFHTGNPEYEAISGSGHSLIEMYRHPLWKGRIKRIRIALAPGESQVKFAIDSFFTVFDSRHTINNPIYILACWNYYRWTGDAGFLREAADRMRRALRYQQTVMGGLQYNHIRVPWPGHDGLPGYIINADGTKTIQYGHGIGNNYWDIMPFGWDDMYATSQYYASLLAMAEMEQAVAQHPEWGVPRSDPALEPDALRRHAAAVKEEANRKFWNESKGRFFGWIDQNGKAYEYGFTFLNLDAIWYGIVSEEHERAIMQWLSGERIVEGDTATGADIYRWRFGPRATTLRNLDCYGFGWTAPETIPWGGQVQDGGAVLGFAFYDLWGYLQVLSPDRAWKRLSEMLDWEREVWAEGGYRKYYEGGKHGNTLQGSGTAGGIGIDQEFFESSLIPSIVTQGFLGLRPNSEELEMTPRLPEQCPSMGVSNLLYRDVRLDVRATNGAIEVAVKDKPAKPIKLLLKGKWKRNDNGESGTRFALGKVGIYRFDAVR